MTCCQELLDDGSAVLADRKLTVGGLSLNLDVKGRTRGAQEPHAPDATIEDVDALVAAVETRGTPLTFVEKTTLKTVKVYPTEPGSPLTDCDSAIYRKTSDSLVTRADA